MAESELRCNHLSCRALLSNEGKAVVTNCSHIFCISCANTLFNASQICPACESKLTEPDDIVISSLSPTTDYKSSILSGLPPSTVLEIASRALSFWTYQVGQEGAFQGMVLKNAQERLMGLERSMNGVNEELQAANNRISNLMNELDIANRKNGDLVQKHADKDREYTKLRMNYDKLKRKHLIGTAAQMADAVNDQVQHSVDPVYVNGGGGGGGGGGMGMSKMGAGGGNDNGMGTMGDMGIRPRSSGSGSGNGNGNGLMPRNPMMRSVTSTPSGQPQPFVPNSSVRPRVDSHGHDQAYSRHQQGQQPVFPAGIGAGAGGGTSTRRQILGNANGIMGNHQLNQEKSGYQAVGFGMKGPGGYGKVGAGGHGGIIRSMPTMQPRRL